MQNRISIPGIVALCIGLFSLITEWKYGLLSDRMGLIGLSGVGKVLAYLLAFLGTLVGVQQIITKAIAHGRRATLIRSRVFFPLVGRVYLGIMTTMFIAAVVGKSNPLLLVFCLMATPWVLNGFTAYTQLRQIAVERATPARCEAGQVVPISVKLSNRRRWLPVWMFTVRDRIDGPMDGAIKMKTPLEPSVAFLRIPAKQFLRRTYRVRLPRRGRYEFGPLQADTRFPLGLIERGLVVPDQKEVLVHPRIGTLSPEWRRRVQRAREQVSRAQTRVGSFDDDFHRVREYQTGDDPRAVHWPTSARRGSLVVREFRESRDRPLALAVDLWSDGGRLTDDVERALDLAATIAIDHSRTSQRSGMTCFLGGLEVVEWSSASRSDLGRLLDCMTLIAPASVTRGSELLKRWWSNARGDERLVWITTGTPPNDLPSDCDVITADASTVNAICHWEANGAAE